MSEAELLSTLIAGIYDAALDPTLWTITLGRLSHYVGGSASSLFAKNAATRRGAIFHDDGGIPAAWVSRYTEEYVRYDPTTVRQFFAGVGETLSTADVMPYRQFADSRFNAEWAGPAGLVDSLTTILDKRGADLAMFTVFRAHDDGLHDEPMRRRMKLLTPHLQRAVRIAGLLEEGSVLTGALTETLDGLSAAVFLLNERGAPVHVNISGRRLLETGPLKLTGGRLVAAERADQKDLAAVLAMAADADSPHRGASLPLHGLDGDVFVAYVLPLGDLRHDDLPGGAVAALFVHPATEGGTATPEALALAYGLTPSELRVLLAINEVGGGPAVAESLGIAETTAKFHLRNLFAKTGTHRQADLVKLVAAFRSPVLPV